MPRGDLVLRQGDRVALLGPAGEGDRLRHFLADSAGKPAPDDVPPSGADGVAMLAVDADAGADAATTDLDPELEERP